MTTEEMRIEIGKRIRNRRIELDMTQEELARRAGFKNKASIAKIENGVQGLDESGDVLDGRKDRNQIKKKRGFRPALFMPCTT